MKDEKKRTLYLKVRVSPEEMAVIKKKFESSGMGSLSGFVRAMIFDGYIAQVNENELKELTRIANNVRTRTNKQKRSVTLMVSTPFFHVMLLHQHDSHSYHVIVSLCRNLTAVQLDYLLCYRKPKTCAVGVCP